jgi:hypothetical protein
MVSSRGGLAHTDRVPDDDDRPRDASSAAGSGWADGDDLSVSWSTAVAPDDLSELAADVRAYHRELRAERRHAMLDRLYARRGAGPLAMTVVVLTLVAVVLTLLSLSAPNGGRDTRARPPTNVGVSHGQAGGLLPDVKLVAVSGKTVPSRSLTSYVLALVPVSCDCRALLSQTAADTQKAGLALAVISPGQDAEALALAGQIDRGRTKVYTDAAGALGKQLASSGVTLVVVNRDTTVFHIVRNVRSINHAFFTALLSSMRASRAFTG